VELHLPEERLRIGDLLKPCSRSSARPRRRSCSTAWASLWRQNPSEKIVIFATYLGTVD
jgi:hypothetical protein